MMSTNNDSSRCTRRNETVYEQIGGSGCCAGCFSSVLHDASCLALPPQRFCIVRSIVHSYSIAKQCIFSRAACLSWFQLVVVMQ